MSFTIWGTGFGNSPGTVKLGNTQLSLVGTGWTDTEIEVQVPANAVLGSANIVVTVGTQTSNAVSFNVTNGFGCN